MSDFHTNSKSYYNNDPTPFSKPVSKITETKHLFDVSCMRSDHKGGESRGYGPASHTASHTALALGINANEFKFGETANRTSKFKQASKPKSKVSLPIGMLRYNQYLDNMMEKDKSQKK